MPPPPPDRDSTPAPARAKPCPICGKPATASDSPFCSKRCADVDLHRWLGGVYAVPARPDDMDESDDGEVPRSPSR